MPDRQKTEYRKEMDEFIHTLWSNRDAFGESYLNCPGVYFFPYGSLSKNHVDLPGKVQYHAGKKPNGGLVVIETPAGKLYYIPADEWQSKNMKAQANKILCP